MKNHAWNKRRRATCNTCQNHSTQQLIMDPIVITAKSWDSHRSLHPHSCPHTKGTSTAQLPMPSPETMLLKMLLFPKNSPLSLFSVQLSLVSKSRTGASHWQSWGNRFVPIVRGTEKVNHYSKIERICIDCVTPCCTHTHLSIWQMSTQLIPSGGSY